MSDAELTATIHPSTASIPAATWNGLVPSTSGKPDNPFLDHAFFLALEQSSSANARTGWQPQHLLLERDGIPVALMPLFLKSHSQGEYVFDHAWADAYQRAGGDYYPKLQCSVPFTPVTAPKLWVPSGDPALRRAIQNARHANMPKDKVDAAIKRAAGQDQKDYETIIYEGYGPHGIAVIVETATDNVVRTVANIRSHFKKGGGNMGNAGAVGFMFKKMGVFRLDPAGIDADALELDLIDFGLQELGEGQGEKGEKQLIIRCDFPDFGKLQHALEERKLNVLATSVEYVAQTPVDLPADQAKEVLEMVDLLEQDDDVQNVFHALA